MIGDSAVHRHRGAAWSPRRRRAAQDSSPNPFELPRRPTRFQHRRQGRHSQRGGWSGELDEWSGGASGWSGGASGWSGMGGGIAAMAIRSRIGRSLGRATAGSAAASDSSVGSDRLDQRADQLRRGCAAGATPPAARRAHLGLAQDRLHLVPLDEKRVVARRLRRSRDTARAPPPRGTPRSSARTSAAGYRMSVSTPTPITVPTRPAVSRAAAARSPTSCRSIARISDDVARRVEASHQLVALPPEIVIDVEPPGGATMSRPNRASNSMPRPIGDHREGAGGGQPRDRPRPAVPSAPPRGIGLDGHPLDGIPRDGLGRRGRRRGEHHQAIDRHGRPAPPLQRHHAAERAAGRERQPLDAEVLEQRHVGQRQIAGRELGERLVVVARPIPAGRSTRSSSPAGWRRRWRAATCPAACRARSAVPTTARRPRCR